jgi:hypothetical protein
VKRILVSSVALLTLAACKGGDPFETGPDKDHLQSRLATELPAYVRVTAFDIQASENIGNKVEPVFRTRFSAGIELTTDTFLPAHQEVGAVFVVPHLSSGEERKVYGLADSALTGGAWNTNFKFDANPLQSLGQPRDLFYGTATRVIIRGSAEETAFRQAQRQEKEQALRADDERRQLDEQQRFEAARRERERIQVEAQLQTERIQAQAKADAERRRVQEELEAQRRREEQDRIARAAAEEAALAERLRLEGEVRAREWVTSATRFLGTCNGFGTCSVSVSFSAANVTAKSVAIEFQGSWQSSAGTGTFAFSGNGSWSGDAIVARGTMTSTMKVLGAGRGPRAPETCDLKLAALPSGRLAGQVCRTAVSFSK